jgi:hypothetical protein
VCTKTIWGVQWRAWFVWFGLVPRRLSVKRPNACFHVQYVAFTPPCTAWLGLWPAVSVYLSKAAYDFVVYLFGDMAVHFGNLLALPAPVQDPINPLSCRSIPAAAVAPTLTRFDARLHPAFTRESIPTCLESVVRAMVPSNTSIPPCIQRVLGLSRRPSPSL